MEGENIKLRRYLLGVLSGNENETIDHRVISDEGFEEELSLAENDLMEDFLEDTLSADEKELFYLNFLTSSKRKAQLREVASFKEFSKKEFEGLRRSDRLRTKAVRPYRKFAIGLRPFLAFGVFLVLLISVTLVWRNYFRQTISPLATEYAELNGQDLSDLTKTANYYVVNLSAGTFRDPGAASKHESDKLTEKVLFRLALPGEAPVNAEFKTKIMQNGSVVLSLDGVRAYRNRAGAEVRLLVPKLALTKGSYLISLESTGPTGNIETYVFTID